MMPDDDERQGLHNLERPQGAASRKRRKGRGPGSGLGKTAGRGQKGQRSRSGGGVRPGFEGGQMPLIRRVPKRGFHNIFGKTVQIVNVRDLDKVSGDEITPETLEQAGLIPNRKSPVKILATGDFTRSVTIRGCAVSKGAKEKISGAGGRVEG